MTAFAPELREVVDDVLGPHADGRGSDVWPTLESLDWPLAGIDEDRGGAGGDDADALEIVAGVARHAVAAPVAETMLAARVLARIGAPLEGVRGGAVVLEGTSARGIAWVGSVAALVIVISDDDGADVALTGPAGATVTPSVPDDPGALDGVPRADVLAAGDVIGRLDAGGLARLRAETAAFRTAATLGACERACALAAEHVRTREQFGRPLAAFQAIGQQIADVLVERDLVAAALRAWLADPRPELALATRVVADRAAGTVAEGTHQLLGAMGITREHALHHATRRLWAGREADGGDRAAAQRLGEHVLSAGTDDTALWSLVTGG